MLAEGLFDRTQREVRLCAENRARRRSRRQPQSQNFATPKAVMDATGELQHVYLVIMFRVRIPFQIGI